MKYVLIWFIVNTGTGSTVFNDQEACEAARLRMEMVNGVFAAYFTCEPIATVVKP